MSPLRFSRFTIFLAAFLSVTAWACADSIIWVSGQDGKLRRSNLDGSNIQVLGDIEPFPLSHQGGIAVHEGKIYWGTSGNYHWANLDGTGQQPVGVIPEVVRIKLLKGVMDSAGNTYFGPLGADEDNEPPGGGFSPPAGVAIDNIRGKLYWAGGWNELNAGLLQRANLDGSNVETLYTGQDLHFEDYPIDIEIDPIAGMIYWVGNMSWIARAPLDGGVAPQIIFSGMQIETMALDLQVPEPASLILFAGAALLACRRSRQALTH